MKNQPQSELLEAITHEFSGNHENIKLIFERAQEEIAQTGKISEYSSKTMGDVLEKTKSLWHEIETLIQADKSD